METLNGARSIPAKYQPTITRSRVDALRDGVSGKPLLFVQFSDKLLTKDRKFREYYETVYRKVPGYHLPEHFMELPYWIPVVSGVLPVGLKRNLMIVENIDSAIETINLKFRNHVILISLLDANEELVRRLIVHSENIFILGGYTRKEWYENNDRCGYLSRIAELPEIFPLSNLDRPPEYSLFDGAECIPRLTLSTGCAFQCRFCTDIPLTVREVAEETISLSVCAMRRLKFRFIYLDDKSFGQAKNVQSLSWISSKVRSYNEEFAGFVVQTPPALALKGANLERWRELGVRIIESGIELVDDKFLRKMNKAYREAHLSEFAAKIRENGLLLVPNIIIGFPDSNYAKTIAFVRDNLDIIPWVNINYFSVHNNNIRGALALMAKNNPDGDQNIAWKSWSTMKSFSDGESAIEELYELTRSFASTGSVV
ncbi:MAG: hypothetical protein HKL90_07095 [Elusimicrobia bacterium]|nr:hypothetical protein [Elusimicrobiota bacterium]